MNTISIDEENRLYAISAVPLFIVSVIFAVFYLFGHFAFLPSGASIMWDMLWNLIIPGIVLAPTTFFLTYEILTWKKEKSMALHVKRFLGRMAILLICTSLLILVYLASFFLLAPLISERFAVLSSLLIWLVALIMGLATFRGLFDKLEKGGW
jgi:divalent metal cation (Fe/Co/Zn/Cd) transporter